LLTRAEPRCGRVLPSKDSRRCKSRNPLQKLSAIATSRKIKRQASSRKHALFVGLSTQQMSVLTHSHGHASAMITNTLRSVIEKALKRSRVRQRLVLRGCALSFSLCALVQRQR